MTQHDRTLIDDLAEIAPGSPVDTALRARADARLNAEESYRILLHPAQPGPVSLADRRILAVFVAALHAEPRSQAHFRALLAATPGVAGQIADLVESDAGQSSRPGPYGRFPEGPLSVEDLDGPVYAASPQLRHAIGERAAAALEHAHLLVLHPRDASQDALEKLLRAGWSTEAVVVISQLVAFLTFQIRVVAGLRAVILSRQPLAELVR